MKKPLTTIMSIVIALIALFIIGALVWGQTLKMAKANRLLMAAKPEQAQAIYEQMAAASPQSPYILHNLGLAFYKEAQYDKAVANFGNAQKRMETPESSSNQSLQHDLGNRVGYNLGDAFFKQAEKSPGSQNQNAYQSALDNFKKAILADRTDRDAKYNYELTKVRLQQAQKEQSQKNSDKNQNQNKKQDQKGQPNNKPDSSNRPSQEKNAASQPGKGQMTKEEAEELLRMMESQDQSKAPLSSIHESQPKQDW